MRKIILWQIVAIYVGCGFFMVMAGLTVGLAAVSFIGALIM